MDFSSMSGWDFERYCADCLLKKGFTKAEVTSGSGDHGVDIIAEQNGIRFGIQCKLYQGQIPNKAVQEAYTGASYYDCDVAVIMSNSELTKQAQTEAKKLRVKFWNIVDYMPEDSKTRETSVNLNSSMPQNYNEYIQQKKLMENKIRQEVESKIQSKQDTTSNDNVIPALKAYQNEEFVDALAWLTPQSLRYDTWYPFICSIEIYLRHLENIDKGTLSDTILLSKLSYIGWLDTTLNVVGSGLHSTLWDSSSDVVRFLQTNATGATSVKSETINSLYWNVQYLFEQEQIVFDEIRKVIESFSIPERIKIKEISLSNQRNGIEDEIHTKSEKLNWLEKWWKSFPEKQEWVRTDISFIKDDSRIAEAIQKNKECVEFVYERVINYEEYRNLQIQKEKKEKELMVQSIVSAYRNKCQEITLRNSSQNKELKNKAQDIIGQAEQQITDSLKKKETFTFFRKKRDAKIDATIATVEQNIEQLKKELANDIAKRNAEMQEEIRTLQEQILDEAEKDGVKEEVEKAIKC